MVKSQARRAAIAVVFVSAAAGLTACGSSTDASVQITTWLAEQGVSCGSGGSYDATTVSAVPFTRVLCDGVEFDFFTPAAADRYDAFWAADCAATPVGQRPALDAVVVVRGPTWVLRGDPSKSGSWPTTRTGSRAVTPSAAADQFGGSQTTLGAVCRELGGWPA